jgi:hypothetical protein
MKRKLQVLLLLTNVLLVLTACTKTPVTKSNTATVQNSNKTLVQKAEETVFGTEKTGIPECDAALAQLEKQSENPDESILESTKRVAAKQSILAVLREKLDLANASPAEKAAYGRRCQQIAASFVSSAPQKN